MTHDAPRPQTPSSPRKTLVVEQGTARYEQGEGLPTLRVRGERAIVYRCRRWGVGRFAGSKLEPTPGQDGWLHHTLVDGVYRCDVGRGKDHQALYLRVQGGSVAEYTGREQTAGRWEAP